MDAYVRLPPIADIGSSDLSSFGSGLLRLVPAANSALDREREAKSHSGG